MARGWRFAVLLSGFLACGLAAADETGARQQLAAEGRALDARYEREQADCRQRFALNACLDEARAKHRRDQAALKARQRALDESLRQQRAAERQSDIDRRQQAVQSRLAAPEATAPSRSTPARTAPAVPRDSEVRRSQAAAAARAKAEERAEAARRLQASIQADQARIRERQAKREAQGRKAQALPTPASAPG
jgi:colicin import membrane protein